MGFSYVDVYWATLVVALQVGSGCGGYHVYIAFANNEPCAAGAVVRQKLMLPYL